jgi:hypothetical protein
MYVFACGGYGDVWKGSLWDGVETRKVPISELYSMTLSQMFCLGCSQGPSTTERSRSAENEQGTQKSRPTDTLLIESSVRDYAGK